MRKFKLSATMVQMLANHLVGPCRYRIRDNRIATRRVLLREKLLRIDRPTRPRRTSITDAGRAELAKALAIIADQLDPHGFGLPIDSPNTQPAETFHPRHDLGRRRPLPSEGQNLPSGPMERASSNH